MYNLRLMDNSRTLRNLTVELVDTLSKGIVASENLIIKYYGTSAPKSVFKAQTRDRLVFWNPEIGYIIMPEHPRNKDLWVKLEDKLEKASKSQGTREANTTEH